MVLFELDVSAPPIARGIFVLTLTSPAFPHKVDIFLQISVPTNKTLYVFRPGVQEIKPNSGILIPPPVYFYTNTSSSLGETSEGSGEKSFIPFFLFISENTTQVN